MKLENIPIAAIDWSRVATVVEAGETGAGDLLAQGAGPEGAEVLPPGHARVSGSRGA